MVVHTLLTGEGLTLSAKSTVIAPLLKPRERKSARPLTDSLFGCNDSSCFIYSKHKTFKLSFSLTLNNYFTVHAPLKILFSPRYTSHMFATSFFLSC